jgi:hypothetical protein
MEVTYRTTSNERRLFTVGPYMAEQLIFKALCETCAGSVCLNLDNAMAKAGQMNSFLGYPVYR